MVNWSLDVESIMLPSYMGDHRPFFQALPCIYLFDGIRHREEKLEENTKNTGALIKRPLTKHPGKMCNLHNPGFVRI